VAVELAVAVGVAVAVELAVGVGDVTGVAVAVAVGVGVGEVTGVAVGVDVAVAVAVALGVGDAPGAAIVKFVSEISKKMLPTASILTRAVVVCISGISTDSVPSFGVLTARTTGKVLPPSVESEILTFAALTGAAVVPLTFQVTLKLLKAGTLTAVFGAVTANGPAVPLIVTTEVAVLIPPPLARLSRVTTWNVMLRAIAGSSSPVR
jgi:ABC-type amino acid transport substrate-binding protein